MNSTLLFYSLIAFIILIVAAIGEHKLKKYEFMNTTEGGVLQFDSYFKSWWHGAKGRLLYAIQGISVIVATVLLVLAGVVK
ncbi:MAG: hypothetical protein COA52_11615 [Hyphomicrobiales bacterium]|nr:hypothetical protein [Hyphomicrobiales bacterium]PCJ89733.1 MAG: hypothetical protein COA52_11615 [Hyphomicrobiales bacterium]